MGIPVADTQIVDQQAHAHAPLRREQRLVEQHRGGLVVGHHVVLEVECVSSHLCQRRPRQKCILPGSQQAKAGHAGLGRQLGRETTRQLRVLWIVDGVRRLVGRQA